MANLIQMKRSATPTKIPTVLDLELGEFAINTFDGKVFIKKDNGTESIVEVGVRGGTAVQNVFYVSKSGDDLNDGKSLDQSKKTIRSAVEATRLTHATATAAVNAGGVASISVVNRGAGYITSLTASSFASKTGSGPYYVTINFPAQEASPPTGVKYRVVGNGTAGYNGTFLCAASTSSSITLSYPTDPGSWGGGTTTITISPLFLRPTVTIFGDGSGATASATVLDGQVKSITVTAPGTGYTTASVVISQSPTNSVVFVKSGDYTEINPIFIPAGVSVVGDSLRTTSVRPATQSNDIFWVNSKSYFTELTFRSHIGNAEPYPAAFSFPRYFISSVTNASPVRVKLGFNYNRAKCSRDVGLIVDAVALDLKFPTAEKSQTTFAGIQYWNQSESAIAGEETATVATYKYLRELAARVVTEDTSGTPYQGVVTQNTSGTAATSTEANIVRDEFNLIIDIIENGTVGVTDLIVPNGITASGVANVQNAYAQLQANKAFLKAEATAFIGTVFPDLVYNTSTCERDVGYLVDSICFDLLYGGNKQAVQSGTYYYSYDSSGNFVDKEKSQTTAAYRYIKNLVSYIITNTAVPSPYQASVTQNVSGTPATISEVGDAETLIDNIVNIINNGPSVAPAFVPISLTTGDAGNQNAAARLLANRDFIKAEVTAYIDAVVPFAHPFYSGDNITIRDVAGMAEINNGYVHVVTAATQANPVRLTFNKGHTFADGTQMNLSDVVGMVELNGRRLYAKYVSTTQVDLYQDPTLLNTVDGTGYAAYVSGGEVRTDSNYFVRKVSDTELALYADPALTKPISGTAGLGFGTATSNTGYVGAGYVFTSPYVHNCSSITSKGTGMRVDGSRAAGLRSMVLDSFTQLNEGGTGIEMVNRGYAQLVSIFTICTDKSIVCKDGGFCSITNSNSSFGRLGLVADGVSEALYSGAANGSLQTGRNIFLDGLNDRPNYGDAMKITSTLGINDLKIIGRSASVSVAGSGYSANELLTPVGVTGTAPVFKVASVKVVGTPTVASGGSSGFASGNRLVFSDGYSVPAILEVTGVSGGGAITALSIVNPGVKNTAGGTVAAPDDQTNPVTVNLAFGVNTVDIDSFGDITVAPFDPAVTTSSGAGLGAKLNVVYCVQTEFNNDHFFVGGERISISSVGGMTQLNGKDYYVELTGDADVVYLHRDIDLATGVDVQEFNAYTSGGSATVDDYFTVDSATDDSGGTTSTVSLTRPIRRPLPDNTAVTFHQRSVISASSHTFEFIGSGNTLSTATPESGAFPIQANEIGQYNAGAVYFTSTDQVGDFRIGTELVINRDTGTISGRTFNKSLFAVLTPYILALEG